MIYDINTYWEKVVGKYSGLNLFEVNELDYIDYLILRRDAFIWEMNKTDEGREYLENAKRLTNTKIDMTKLKNTFGKEE